MHMSSLLCNHWQDNTPPPSPLSTATSPLPPPHCPLPPPPPPCRLPPPPSPHHFGSCHFWLCHFDPCHFGGFHRSYAAEKNWLAIIILIVSTTSSLTVHHLKARWMHRLYKLYIYRITSIWYLRDPMTDISRSRWPVSSPRALVRVQCTQSNKTSPRCLG